MFGGKIIASVICCIYVDGGGSVLSKCFESYMECCGVVLC